MPLPAAIDPRAISGTDKALMYALSQVARSGATRSGYISGRTYILIDGILSGPASPWRVLSASLSIQDALNEVPNTCTFTIQGDPPRMGADIVIAAGSINNPSRLFGGTIIRSTQVYFAQNPAQIGYQIEATDYTWRLSHPVVAARYTNQSATAIALDLIARFGPVGYTAQIPAGLPTVDEVSMSHVPLIDALMQLAQRIGGYAKVDYAKRIWLWTTTPPGAPPAPAPLTPTHPTLSDVSYTRDLSQIVTRAIIEGGGVNTLGPVPAGETRIPVADVAWYAPAGGRVTSGPQRISYTGTVAAGGGALASAIGGATGNVSPPAAPTIGSAPGAGLPMGSYGYAYTWVTAAGETLPSAAGVFQSSSSGPAAAPSAAAIAGTELDVGQYRYAYSWITGGGTGETVPSPLVTVETTASAIPEPYVRPAVVAEAGPGLAPNTYYRYAYTYVTGVGETTLGPTNYPDLYIAPAPGAPGAPQPLSYTGGQLTPGATYGFAFVYAADQGNPPQWLSAISQRTTYTLPAGKGQVQAQCNVSTRGGLGRIWALRTKANDALGALYYCASANDAHSGATNLSFGDLPDGALTAQVGTPGTWAQARVRITSVAPGPPGVTSRKIYRSPITVGYGLVATINNNLDDGPAAPDSQAQVGPAPPATNTTAQSACRVSLSGIAVGPAGTTGRGLYRTTVNGSALKFLIYVPNNTQTTWTDTAADSTLSRPPPASSNAPLTQAVVSNILVGSGLVTARKVYRADIGIDPTYKLHTTIANNSATSLPADSTPYANLGAAAPTSDTSGLTSGPVGGVVNAGSTQIPVANTAPFAPEGWALAGGQLLRYRGTTATHITGIPASGIGSLTIAIPYDTVIEVTPQLIGIPASGAGAMTYALQEGDPVNVLAIVDDQAAQTALASVIGGTGIVEGYRSDGRISLLEATARARALLDLRGLVRETIRYRSRDPRTISGTEIAVALPAPWNISGTFQIQDVRLSAFAADGRYAPTYDVVASSARFSFEDLIRQRRG